MAIEKIVNYDYKGTPTKSSVSVDEISVNKVWEKYIPLSNKVCMIISLLLFLGLDLYIVITNPELFSFWMIMAGVMAIFAGFYYYENKKLSERFRFSQSKLDRWILFLVWLRNIIFILNFIPVVQLFVMFAVGVLGIPYVLIYGLIVWRRYKVV